MQQKSLIILTGGGSSGHVTPNLALIEKAQQEGYSVAYIGSEGIEKVIINQTHIPFHTITSGKLRRHFSLQNLRDPFKVLKGIVQAWFILRRLKPKIIFSKGGFVAVPVVIAGYLHRIPVVIHESDYTPGLANRISLPFSKKVCVNYQGTKNFLPVKEKVEITGTPIRKGFSSGSKERALEFLQFSKEKPILLMTGGGLGSQYLNETLVKILPELCETFQVVHLCGKGKLQTQFSHPHYRIYEYLHDEMYDVMVAADLIVSRAGANAVYEILALRKLNILIPLPKKASRGDQLDNARFAEEKGYSCVLQEEHVTPSLLLETILKVFHQPKAYQSALQELQLPDAVEKIWHVLQQEMRN